MTIGLYPINNVAFHSRYYVNCKCYVSLRETGDEKMVKDYLPRDKQFLATRNGLWRDEIT